MKKVLVVMLSLALMLALTAPALAGEPKIAILSSPATQNDEELSQALAEIARTPGMIVHDTYSDAFMAEQELTISKLLAFADDPDVKAIVMCQAVPGCEPGFNKIREMGRDDILLIGVLPQEDPDVISASADFTINTDPITQGEQMIEKMVEWDIDVFLHYSFPRHMAMEPIVLRYNLFRELCDALGIEMYDVVSPDPTNEATGGTPAAQQFVLEDVPAQMEKYAGKKVAMFSTNCAMQPALQRAILEQPNAYYPSPCDPSPFHRFPETLSLELKPSDGTEVALKQIAAALAEHGALNRFSTWDAPATMMGMEVAVEYAREWIAGTITERNDMDALVRLFHERSPLAVIDRYTNVDGVTFDNYYVLGLTYVDFNDYLD